MSLPSVGVHTKDGKSLWAHGTSGSGSKDQPALEELPNKQYEKDFKWNKKAIRIKSIASWLVMGAKMKPSLSEINCLDHLSSGVLCPAVLSIW